MWAVLCGIKLESLNKMTEMYFNKFLHIQTTKAFIM